MKWLLSIFSTIMNSKAKEGTKIVLFILTFIGMIIILKYIKGENGTSEEIVQAINNQDAKIEKFDKKLNTVITNQYYFEERAKKADDSIMQFVKLNSSDIRQVKRVQCIMMEENTNGVKKRIEESEQQHDEERKFIEDHSYIKSIPGNLTNGNYPEMTNGILFVDTVKVGFRPLSALISLFDRIL